MKTISSIYALLALSVMSFSACSDDDGDDEKSFTVNPSSVTFRHGDEVQLEASDNTQVTWSVLDDYYAKIDDSGKLTALHVGATAVKATDSQGKFVSVPVAVVPEYLTYTEPYLNWGASKSEVKGKETRNLDSEDDASLIFTADDDIVVVYMFEDGALSGAAISVKPSNLKDVIGFLGERYWYLGYKDKFYVFTDKKSVSVGAKLTSLTKYLITYVPYTASNKSLSLDEFELPAFD
ncbi:MAG: Ig-like domain-containing protein [Marinilabiliaceae bacterium]